MLNKRGSVAVWVGVSLPGLIMATALPIVIGSWEAARARLQRTADVSALAGMINFKITNDGLDARTEAEKMARLNHIERVTAESVSGIVDGANHAITVTVSLVQPVLFLRRINGQTSFTISAEATAELLSGEAPPHGQPDLRHAELVK